MPQSWNLPPIEKYPAKKVRKWNKVAERQLENQLNTIDQKRSSLSEKLEQSIRTVKRQLDHLDHEIKLNDVPIPRFPTPSSGSISGRISATSDSVRNIRTRSFSCVYTKSNKNSMKCRYFPCNKPSSYHTIGYRIDPDNTDWIPWTKLRNSLRDSALSAVQKSMLLNVNTGVSRLRAERREEILKLEMEKRRKRQEIEKPPSWEINYGKPTSIRRLKYPVRLQPLSA